MQTDDSPGPRRPLLLTIGHYADPLFPAYIIGMVALGAAFPQMPISVALATQVVLVFLVYVQLGVHRGKLCGLCAAATPLNGGAVAEKHDRSLKVFHYLTSGLVIKRIIPVRFVVLVFGLAVVGLVLSGKRVGLPGRYGDIAFLVVFLTPMAYLMWVNYRHNRLHPWCPYCKWGGGGEKETVPDPDPSVAR